MNKFKPIQYRAHNGYDTAEASQAAANLAGPPGESLTVQSMAEDADINVMMKRYGLTGKMPENVRIPTYGDFSGISDYRTALHAVRDAEEGFLEIPADVRAKFDNDPQLFMEFANNPQNLPAMVELGLAKARPQEKVNEQNTTQTTGNNSPEKTTTSTVQKT